MKRLLATGILTLSVITAGAGLSACGSSTVSDDATASASNAPIAPLKGSGGSGATSGAAGASDGAGAGASGAGGSGGAGESGNAAPPADGPAQEVSSIPTPAQQLSDADKTYFDALTAGGIKVEGAENQMIGAAQVVCQNQFPQAVQAVGGQLVEQKRTSLSPEEAVSLIETSARKAYCS
ncbi:DUF732 domain-containing protein [uncultured Corynebacterium sp.]|uniref:DUF732 domain-containing protein n=1 Tax=uncultured Corynebacterium sp. TaxID=159447 RepID=UPI0028D80A39|nr:DUF732 domain-containing protein [uncultured Corynebacterium sp.]